MLLLIILFFLKVVSGFNIPLTPIMVIIGLYALGNLFFPLMFLRYRFLSDSQFYIYWRATIDMLFITMLIHYTGGSPLRSSG